ncbi:MAG: YcbK family protein [Alphaproteobacteria bacterium]
MNRRVFLAAACGLMASRPAMALPAAAPRRIKLHNAHTKETFEGPYRDEHGPIAAAMEDLSHLLRDHRSGQRIAVDIGVIDFLAGVMDGVGASRATVLSAYRTLATNRMLAKTTFGVADNSHHIYGRALDIRLDSRLEDAMRAARAMRRGGVGWYPRSRFVHLDTGPVRNWTLDGGGFDGLLSRLEELLAKSGLPKDIVAGRARRPLNVQQRLSLQRAIARAEFLARKR